MFSHKEIRTRWYVKPIFEIVLLRKLEKDLALLEQIKSFFNVGSIHKKGLLSIQYRVQSVKDLAKIIDHYEKYSLITQKQADYLLFKQVFNLINKKEHLTIEGIKKNYSNKRVNEFSAEHYLNN